MSTRETLLYAALQEIYQFGYQGASIAKILKVASIPKGSLYHYFESKKALALAVISELIVPGIINYFASLESDLPLEAQIEQTIDAMAKNESLLINGCPLNKLIQEMSQIDSDFESLLSDSYTTIETKLNAAVIKAQNRGEIKKTVSSQSITHFLLSTTWGYLAYVPKFSTKERFLELKTHLHYYFKAIEA